eukprot:3250007-Alexandrium_andersonii.AAC.1
MPCSESAPRQACSAAARQAKGRRNDDRLRQRVQLPLRGIDPGHQCRGRPWPLQRPQLRDTPALRDRQEVKGHARRRGHLWLASEPAGGP